MRVEHDKRTRIAAEKEAKAIAIGQDGFYLLDAIYAENTSASIRSLKAVEVLRQDWLQQYYAPIEGKVQLQSNKDGPPHAKRIFSPYEIEACIKVPNASPVGLAIKFI